MTIILNAHGRLGNILFQYAALRNLCIKKKYNFFINAVLFPNTLVEILKVFNIKNGSNYNQNEINNEYKSSNSNLFDEKFFGINDNTFIEGYFENIEYFKDNIDIIKNDMKIVDPEINNFTNNYIDEISKNNFKIVGIHFRRGDIFSTFTDTTLFKQNHEYNIHLINYTKKILDIIKKDEKNISIIIFTGGSGGIDGNESICKHQYDINWVNNFIIQNESEYNIFLSPGTLQNNEFLDYSLMSKCDYMIVPYQSTISFMACYTSEKNIKIFSPTNLYGGGVTVVEK